MANSIMEYGDTRAALEEFRGKFVGRVYDVTTTAGMKDAKSDRAEIRKARTTLEAKRKELKEPLLARSRALDAEAKFLTDALLELEDPLDALIKAEEARIAAEKAERERIERERVAALKMKMARWQDPVSVTACKEDVIERIVTLEGTSIAEAEWGEFFDDAVAAKVRGLSILRAALEAFIEREEREAELERLRAEQAARDAAERAAAAEEAERIRMQAEQEMTARLEEASADSDSDASAPMSGAETEDVGLFEEMDKIPPLRLVPKPQPTADGVSAPRIEMVDVPATGKISDETAMNVIRGEWETILVLLASEGMIDECGLNDPVCNCSLRNACEVISCALRNEYTDWYGSGQRPGCSFRGAER